ncbi:hypothetical protein KY290_025648 [Solanum tuberosum]|uniref:Uncharacterized protein n=1 Tax=Solanum tuberosum TaxID=4113 RepID=A0ABQ7UW58_SOLTU|nr:hypothetical protein KY289_024723 [Solanum tuberosum]KAH0755378.1 hypothetical protein KY290_025648 [Solanum tuberosum]
MVIVALTVPFFGYVMTFTGALLGDRVDIVTMPMLPQDQEAFSCLEVTDERFGQNLDGSNGLNQWVVAQSCPKFIWTKMGRVKMG